ncbi:MAG: hypothetical protein HN712_19440 [Gemmatimonadetes bacterium]|jgi:hypothetical protein|nr:hypothetical protein [Gemmatimonadota bacterium]MBT7862499.1 hypothetical protein [Gemmatimonadota bacterium]
MKRARVSRPRRSPLLPLLQGGIGCVVLAILLALLNACGESPVAPAGPSSSAVVAGDAAARAVAVAIALASEEEGDAVLAGDHSGSLQVTVNEATDRQLRLEFVDYSDDGVSFLDGAMTVTWSETGTPHFSGDLQIRAGQGEPESANLEGEVISLPGGGTMTLVIDWPAEPGDGGQEVPDSDVDAETDADVVPSTIRLSESAQEAVWQMIRDAAERGAGIHAGQSSGRVLIRLTRTVTATETDRVTDTDGYLRFEQYSSTSRFWLGGALQLRSRRDTQGRFRVAISGEVLVYTASGVAAYTPSADVVRKWLDARQIASSDQQTASDGQVPNASSIEPTEAGSEG